MTTSQPPFPQELINNVDHCYRIHLLNNYIKMLDEKLAWYGLIGDNRRCLILMLVSKCMCQLIFNAYHAKGVNIHIKINKTLTFITLRFIWLSMRKDISIWVKGYLECIHLQHYI